MTLAEVGTRRVGRLVSPRVSPLAIVVRVPRRGLLPLGFGRKAPAPPSRVGVGLVPTDVLDGLGEVERRPSAEPENRPRRPTVASPELGVLEARLAAPRPAVVAPPAGVVIAVGVDELEKCPIRDRRGVDEEGVDVHLVRGPLVVVGPRLRVGAHHEGPAVDEHLRGCDHRGTGRRFDRPQVDGAVLELQRREHRLDVLVLVLDDHPVHEATAQQPHGGIELHPVERVEGVAAHGRDVRPRVIRAQQRQPGPVGPRMPEGVVHVVVLLTDALVPEPAQQPDVLVVADVRQVPHQR